MIISHQSLTKLTSPHFLSPINYLSTTMASSSLLLPSIQLNHVSSSSRSSHVCFNGYRNGFIRRFNNTGKGRVSMSVESVTAVDDKLFNDYKPSTAFLFPGQVIF